MRRKVQTRWQTCRKSRKQYEGNENKSSEAAVRGAAAFLQNQTKL